MWLLTYTVYNPVAVFLIAIRLHVYKRKFSTVAGHIFRVYSYGNMQVRHGPFFYLELFYVPKHSLDTSCMWNFTRSRKKLLFNLTACGGPEPVWGKPYFFDDWARNNTKRNSKSPLENAMTFINCCLKFYLAIPESGSGAEKNSFLHRVETERFFGSTIYSWSANKCFIFVVSLIHSEI